MGPTTRSSDFSVTTGNKHRHIHWRTETFNIRRTSRDPAPRTTTINVAAQVATPTTRITGWTQANRNVVSVQPMECSNGNKELQSDAPKGKSDKDDAVARPDTGP